MEEQILIDSIYQSMQDSARQVRRSLGRTSFATTREEALNQVEMLQQAKQAAQQIYWKTCTLPMSSLTKSAVNRVSRLAVSRLLLCKLNLLIYLLLLKIGTPPSRSAPIFMLLRKLLLSLPKIN